VGLGSSCPAEVCPAYVPSGWLSILHSSGDI
jgi:hypothetical protein